ncbi:hypothetical protein [Photobacterium leiognathi]|uniref:hypothetical protein n=1 Tax=Photobacterium leiognathi TaxID=553611 RepID=UPI002980F05E|nr:hypothetical protein [Photobacterium leiognathi]
MHFTHDCALSGEKIVFDDSNSQFSISLTGSSDGTESNDLSATAVFTNDEARAFILSLNAACSMAFSTGSGDTPFEVIMELDEQPDESYCKVKIKVFRVATYSIEIHSLTPVKVKEISAMLKITEVIAILNKLDAVLIRIQKEY